MVAEAIEPEADDDVVVVVETAADDEAVDVDGTAGTSRFFLKRLCS